MAVTLDLVHQHQRMPSTYDQEYELQVHSVRASGLHAPVVVQGHSAAGLHVSTARLQPAIRLLHARGRQRVPLPLPAQHQLKLCSS